jgi:hypothetical protein
VESINAEICLAFIGWPLANINAGIIKKRAYNFFQTHIKEG